jgi:RimJ/RimL family protein N-acetyltransferase
MTKPPTRHTPRLLLRAPEPADVASVRVLVKAGFERVRFVHELERDEYRVSAEWWRGG